MHFLLDSLLFALALCVDSFAVSTTSALKEHYPWRRGLLLAATFAVFQGGFPLIGALLGSACQQYVAAIDHWIAFVLLCGVGGRMVWEAVRGVDDSKSLDLNRWSVMCTLAIATSIDAFVVGIGMGLENTLGETLVQVLMIAVVTFVVSLMGVWLGRRGIAIPERWVTAGGGVVLIGMGVKILLEHLLLA